MKVTLKIKKKKFDTKLTCSFSSYFSSIILTCTAFCTCFNDILGKRKKKKKKTYSVSILSFTECSHKSLTLMVSRELEKHFPKFH